MAVTAASTPKNVLPSSTLADFADACTTVIPVASAVVVVDSMVVLAKAVGLSALEAAVVVAAEATVSLDSALDGARCPLSGSSICSS